jgi:hypothetical protein
VLLEVVGGWEKNCVGRASVSRGEMEALVCTKRAHTETGQKHAS